MTITPELHMVFSEKKNRILPRRYYDTTGKYHVPLSAHVFVVGFENNVILPVAACRLASDGLGTQPFN